MTAREAAALAGALRAWRLKACPAGQYYRTITRHARVLGSDGAVALAALAPLDRNRLDTASQVAIDRWTWVDVC